MSKRILVADDEAHIQHVLSLKLRNAGYEVITAVDGDEARELCLADPPDLVITDFQMPFMSGLALCRELRQHEKTRDIPVMMLTAREFDLSGEEIRDSGITVILAKPFAPREVLQKVKELLGETAPVSTE